MSNGCGVVTSGCDRSHNRGSPMPQIDGFRISGNWVIANISGQPVSISGQPVVVDVSGIVVNISGVSVEISGDVVNISGQPVTTIAAKNYVYRYIAPAPDALLLSGDIIVSSSFDTTDYTRVIGSVYADVPGEVHIEQSIDSSSWDGVKMIHATGGAVSGAGRNFVITVTNQFARVKYISEDDQMSAFRLSATLCAP